MASTTKCRRQAERRSLAPDSPGVIEFGYPTPRDHPCSMSLRDMSSAGVSFVLAHELPGLEVGRTLRRVTLHVNGEEIHGDLVVMHLTPGDSAGSVCGGLFDPARDSDIIGLKKVLAELQ